MRIVGINSNYNASMDKIYSGGCALIEDGKIVMALAEDRISRSKHEGGFKQSLKHILKETKLNIEDIDYFYISFYANPMIPTKKMIEFHLKELGILDNPEKLVVVQSHHMSHAYAAYFLSPFEEAIIMVADNEGSLLYPKDAEEKNIINNYCERNSYFWARGNCISFMERDFEEPGTVAFGKAYNKFNEYVGFGSYLNAGKTMGLSSYGHITEEMKNLDLWGMDEHGKMYSNIRETYDSYRDIKNFFKENNIDVIDTREEKCYERQEYKDLALYIQEQLNKWSVAKTKVLMDKTGFKNVCLSGGVALNGIVNREIEEKLKAKVFVPPYPSDPGQALGNAIYGYIQQSGLGNNSYIDKFKFNSFTYIGTEYSQEDIEDAINEYRSDDRVTIEYPKDICKTAAKLLSEGKVIGWFNGRSEYGARALGNRSIIADPRSSEIRDRVNTLKGRELFRPLAPSVMNEYVGEYFEGKESILDKYMLKVSIAKKEKKDQIEGVVHVDGTSRVQSVKKEDNSKYYNLINEFYKITGIPMIIDTSFNAAGEPIVESPKDSIISFLNMNLDALVCGDILLIRIK